MSAPLSIRLDPVGLERLRRRAESTPGSSPSGLAQRLIDEGRRLADHPGIVFKDGPAGRRAAVALGPDVAEVVRVVREVDERGPAALDAAAELLSMSPARVGVALGYYADFADEIDAELRAGFDGLRAAVIGVDEDALTLTDLPPLEDARQGIALLGFSSLSGRARKFVGVKQRPRWRLVHVRRCG